MSPHHKEQKLTEHKPPAEWVCMDSTTYILNILDNASQLNILDNFIA